MAEHHADILIVGGGTGGDNHIDISSLPFQIPLGPLLPARVGNLLPA